MNPIVSIIIPLHNKSEYIAETIASVSAQSLSDWELIIVENGSTDNGPKIVQEFAKRDSRIIFIEAPQEVQGPGAARNLGIHASRGEWLQFLDADDLLLAGHLQTMFAKAVSEKESAIITCDWLQGALPVSNLCERKQPTNRPESPHWKKSAIAFTPWVVHAAWIRRDLLGQGPWWDESFDRFTCEDHVFWFRVLLEAKNTAYSSHTGVFYRIRTASSRHDPEDTGNHLKTLDRAIQMNIKLIGIIGQALDYEHRRALLNSYLEIGKMAAKDSQVATLSRERIKEFRPPLIEAIKRKDMSTAASFIIPHSVMSCLQNKWRSFKKSQPHMK